MNAAIENYPGLFICAAGNAGLNNDLTSVYPANYQLDNLITVAASTSEDQKWSPSNYGHASVDIFAPGEDILSCYPIDLCEQGIALCQLDGSIHISNGYHYMDGTSMAAPYVAGVAALILSQNSNMEPSSIKQVILSSVDLIYDSNGNSIFGSLCTSHGRLNAFNAVHNHTYSCSQYDEEQHKYECDCGAYYLVDHCWINDSESIGNFGQTIIIIRCSVCNYIQ